MVLSKMNKTNGYTEEYDIAALQEIADMAMRDAVHDRCNRYIRVTGKRCPDGSYSDMSCNVWEMMNRLIMFGMELRDVQDEELNKVSAEVRIDRFEDFKFMNPICHDIHLRES